jgi:leucyl/phenylalanyl-tRNA---protein transferase
VDEPPAAAARPGPRTGPDPFAALDVAGAPRELVALGGRLDTPTLLSAYRHGCFPWPPSGPYQVSLERSARRLARRRLVPVLPGGEGLVPWCSPDPRAVLLAEQVVVSRSLRQRLRRCGWTTTLDVSFPEVVAACAGRDDTWISGQVQQGFASLREDGVAHSLEVWAGEQLVGGLYGVLVGRVFCGESMFHLTSDASKVALVDLCDRLLAAGVQLVDVQQETEHLTSMGAVLVSRAQYLHALARLRDGSVRLDPARLPVSRLAG